MLPKGEVKEILHNFLDPITPRKLERLCTDLLSAMDSLEWYATAGDYEISNDTGQRAREVLK